RQRAAHGREPRHLDLAETRGPDRAGEMALSPRPPAPDARTGICRGDRGIIPLVIPSEARNLSFRSIGGRDPSLRSGYLREMMFFKQFYLGCLAQASYMIGSKGEAVVVDPRRDVDEYLDEARREGLVIRHVIETHLHADFVSGHRELA